MNVKLTLTVEEKIIQKAKRYARKRGRSLSDIIENYLRVITCEEDEDRIELNPRTKSLKGSFKAPKDLDYKQELSRALSKKYK
jgi:hypothetical protein